MPFMEKEYNTYAVGPPTGFAYYGCYLIGPGSIISGKQEMREIVYPPHLILY